MTTIYNLVSVTCYLKLCTTCKNLFLSLVVVRLVIFLQTPNFIVEKDSEIKIGCYLGGLFRHIHNENVHFKCVYFNFLGVGLRVIYNSDIFENRDPPPRF